MSFTDLLEHTTRLLAVRGKGILAADESTSTIGKRFASLSIPNEVEYRQAYREMLFTTPDIGTYINGVILFEETLSQTTRDGKPFVSLLNELGILPGIKVDQGLLLLALSEYEKVTRGLDDLRERLVAYRNAGARFAKWRAVYDVSDSLPSCNAIEANAEGLARYAALCQEQGIVPIVEPEVLMDGAHSIERCQAVTHRVLAAVFRALDRHRVALHHIVLKPSMVISGTDHPHRANAQTVADLTLEALLRYVPAAVRTINFLSGGQSDEEATLHLDLMNKRGNLPWNLSYSYGRALQTAAMQAWHGKANQVQAGQQAFLKRARLNTLAAKGEYAPGME